MSDTPRMPWGMVAAGASAALVGNGLARFGYSPLLPVLIAQGWFRPGAAAYLGAANLAGYLLGAMLAKAAAERLGLRPVLRGSMALATASLLACCTPLPFAWFFAWRLVSGVTGGLLMILAPSVVLPLVPEARRGLAGGLIFTGVGLGIAASGTLVPLLLLRGLGAAWLGLGAVCAALTVLAWRLWPAAPAGARPAAGRSPPGTVPLCVSYGLFAVGMVPHMVFLVDYVARGQERGMAAGGIAWVVFGTGALCGAVVVGRLADWLGAVPAMRLVIATQLACVALLDVVADPWLSGIGYLVSGMCLSGISAATLARINLLSGADAGSRQAAWTAATIAWAVGQAGAAYGLAWVYARTGGYAALLAIAATGLLAALAIEAADGLRRRSRGLSRMDGGDMLAARARRTRR